MIRSSAAALLCVCCAWGADTAEAARKSVAVSTATRLELNAEFGSIDVEPGRAKRVEVERVEVEVEFRGLPPSRAEFDRAARDFSLDVFEQGQDVRAIGSFRNGWEPRLSLGFFDFLFGNRICHNGRCLKYEWLRGVEYHVRTPAAFGAQLATSGGSISTEGLHGEVTARTSGGSLRFDRIEGAVNGNTSGGAVTVTEAKGKTVVHTSGGSIRIRGISGDVDASTSGGPISIEDVSGYVKVHTSGGPIRASGISGAIDASTSGGSVTASLLAQPKGECRLSTSGGGIEVDLASNIHVNLDASTSGGSVRSDFPKPHTGERPAHKLQGPINGGGPLLYLHTSGGGITVRRGEPGSL